MEASAEHSLKLFGCSGTKEGRPDFWAWLIPALDSEEMAGTFTSPGLKYLQSSEEGIVSRDWFPETARKEAKKKSRCTPWVRTMAVVGDTKRGNKGQCPAKESILLLLRLVFTHGKDLLQNFLDIFIHLALNSIQKMHSVNRYDLLVLFLTLSQLVLELLDLLLQPL